MNLKQLIVGARIGFSRKGSKIYAAFAGTISVTNGSADIVGVGTDFTTLTVGQTFVVQISTYCFVTVTLLTLTDATHAVLAADWTGDTLASLTAFKEAGTTSSVNVKPADAVAGNWTPVGSVLSGDFARNAKYDKVVAPVPVYDVINEILAGSAPMITAVLNDHSEIFFENLFGVTPPITDSTPFAPQSGDGQTIGWWQFQLIDTANNKILTMNLWGSGKFDTVKIDNNQVKPQLKLSVWHNSLATGTSTLASA